MIDKFMHGFLNRVYGYDDYTQLEINSKLIQKIDEVIDECNNAFEFVEWLKEQGVNDELQSIIDTMLEDGTLENLINIDKVNQLFSQLSDSINSELETKVNNNELISSFLKMDNVIITDAYDDLTKTSYTKTIIPYKIDDNIIKWEVSVPKEWTSDNLILETPRNQCLENDFSVCINGGLFRPNNKPIGVTISNGNIITSEISGELKNWYLGINKDTGKFECGKLKNVTLNFLKDKYDNVLTSFVPLIINGVLQNEETLQDCSNYNIKNPRQILCQQKDGTVIIITSDGRSQSQKGWTLLEAQRIIQELNVDFAFNLDGGGSAQTVYRNTLISTPIDDYHTKERKVFSCLGFKIGNVKNQKDEDIKDLSHMIGNLKNEIDYIKHYNIFDKGYISLKSEDQEKQEKQGIDVYQDSKRTNKLQLSKNKLYYFNTENETSTTIFSVDDTGVITTQKNKGHIQNDIAGTGDFEPNNINVTGMYWFLAEQLGIIDGANAYALQHIQSGEITALQIATPYSDNTDYKCKRRIRNVEGTWSNWVDNI